MSEQSNRNSVMSEIGKDEFLSIHPRSVVSVAIPMRSRSEKIKAKLIKGELTGDCEIKVPLPVLPTSDHTVIESIQITDSGLIFVDVLGRSPGEYGLKIIEAMVLMMKRLKMRDFYSALSENTKKTRCVVYSLKDGVLSYKFTLVGVVNMRVVNSEVAIHASMEEKNEIRTISLRDIARGAYLPSSFLGVTEDCKGISFIGRPNINAYNPYIPLTFEDGTNKKLGIRPLLYGKRRSIFLTPSDVIDDTMFPMSATKVIGKITNNLYGAVRDQSLVLLPKKLV